MLKTRLKTAFHLAIFFIILFFAANDLLWLGAIIGLAIFTSYEWHSIALHKSTPQSWSVEILPYLAKTILKFVVALLLIIFIPNFFYFLMMMVAQSSDNNSKALTIYQNTSYFIFFLNILWLCMTVFLLKKDTSGIQNLDAFKEKNPQLTLILFQIMPTVLPALICLNGIYLIFRQQNNIPIILFLGLIWLSDSLAYFAGKKWGKRKLAPNISPNKTWEGAIIGNIAAVLIIFMIYNFLYDPVTTTFLIFLIIAGTAVFGVLGDLFQSKLKRIVGVKDSSQLLPGHGGFFDRFDAMIPAGAFAVVCVFIKTFLE
jgi:phosphatidate cytidylyltransferase